MQINSISQPVHSGKATSFKAIHLVRGDYVELSSLLGRMKDANGVFDNLSPQRKGVHNMIIGTGEDAGKIEAFARETANWPLYADLRGYDYLDNLLTHLGIKELPPVQKLQEFISRHVH